MPESDLIFRFQLHGDLEALVAFGKSLGYEERGLRASLEALQNVFESVSRQEEPDYANLDRSLLLAHQNEAFFVIRMMASSYNAGIKTAAFHVMGALNSEEFIADLGRALASDQDWARIEAIRALGRMSHSEVRSVLEEATGHPDVNTRRAAQEVLEQFDKRADPD